MIRTEVVMGTLVTIELVSDGEGALVALDRAFGWFHAIEERCTRFNPSSELMQLTARIGIPVPVSEVLYEAVRFALSVAEQTCGAFDPTVGHRMETRGFNREHRTGKIVRSPVADDPLAENDATWRDVALNAEQKTVTLRRPLTLDLGAVAKGLAIDTAAQDLAPFRDFAIDAGGDLYLGGLNSHGDKWSVGIRHPRIDGALIDSVQVSDLAVCTSGDYERRLSAGEHHILDPRTGESPHTVASATVIAPGAMLADALATAAFVLGPDAGIRMLDRMGVDGLIFTPGLERHETRGLRRAA